MAEMFAEREKKKRTPSRLPKITRPQVVHLPLASIASAAKHMRTNPEQTQVGPGAVAAADLNMRMAGNVSKLRTSPAEVTSRFLAMLERLG